MKDEVKEVTKNFLGILAVIFLFVQIIPGVFLAEEEIVTVVVDGAEVVVLL